MSANGGTMVGGLVGGADIGSTISNAYATGNVTANGGTSVGGLVGWNLNTISASFWNTTTSGQTTGVGKGSSTGTTGATTAQMMTASTFTGWNISNTGGTTATWRIYEGYTAPLLSSFLIPLTAASSNISKTYNRHLS